MCAADERLDEEAERRLALRAPRRARGVLRRDVTPDAKQHLLARQCWRLRVAARSLAALGRAAATAAVLRPRVSVFRGGGGGGGRRGPASRDGLALGAASPELALLLLAQPLRAEALLKAEKVVGLRAAIAAGSLLLLLAKNAPTTATAATGTAPAATRAPGTLERSADAVEHHADRARLEARLEPHLRHRVRVRKVHLAGGDGAQQRVGHEAAREVARPQHGVFAAHPLRRVLGGHLRFQRASHTGKRASRCIVCQGC